MDDLARRLYDELVLEYVVGHPPLLAHELKIQADRFDPVHDTGQYFFRLFDVVARHDPEPRYSDAATTPAARLDELRQWYTDFLAAHGIFPPGRRDMAAPRKRERDDDVDGDEAGSRKRKK